jgi:hypothetical protein
MNSQKSESNSNSKTDIITILQKDEIKDSIKTKIIKKGENILEENHFFNGLENIMQNTEFRTFYDKYFKDYSDIKTVVLYMKLYETIETEYKKINGKDIEKEFLAYMMRELMCDNIMRKNIIKLFNDFAENNNNKNNKFLLDIFNMDNLKKNYKKLNYN